ncbi:MAG: hypothetical protein IKA71_08900, partial [Lentisphaeria bacterium]|nr:hypothetical protein [Lentisphaeria bacterium]
MVKIVLDSNKSVSYSSLPDALAATNQRDFLTITMEENDYISGNVNIYQTNCVDRHSTAPQLGWNISGGTLSNNTAASGSVVYCRRTSTIDGCTILLNAATAGNGGAIFHDIYGFTIKNSVLNQNSASNNGGAMYFKGSQEFKISNSSFANNTAGSHGGAVYIDANIGVANFSSVSWTGNRADKGNGGAISSYANSGSSLNISSNTFLNNSANFGGAVYLHSNGEILNISGSSFGKNYASTNGGAISAYNDTTITGSSFSGNTAASRGGVIDFDCNSALTVSQSVFSGNTVFRSFSSDGSLNNRLGYGGVIYLAGTAENRSNVLISGSTFTDNNGAYGGVIMNNTTAVTSVATISGSTFAGNRAAHGGVFYSNSGSITISGGLYHDNHADLTDDSGNITGYGGVLATGVRYKNSAEAITIQADSENNRAVFSENSAYLGGVAYIRSSQTHSISQADFIKNTAFYGGVFYMTNESATFDDVKMTGNTANRGGCFYFTADCQDIKIEKSTFSGNRADGHGGVIWSANEFSVSDSVFSGNSCGTGAAIYASGGNAQSTITGTMFSGNTGTTGIICSNAASNDIVISGSTFLGNYGKAIYNYNGKITLSGVLFNDGKDRAIENRGDGSVNHIVFSGSTLATAQDKIYNNGRIDFSGENIICASISGSGTFNVAENTVLTFNNTAEIDIAALTIQVADSNTINLNGAQVNFTDLDVEDVTIVVNGADLTAGAVVAAGVSGALDDDKVINN